MKIGSGLAACVMLVSGLAASAETAAKPRYKRTGEQCTAAEIADPPLVQVKFGGRTFSARVECHTKSEWRLMRAERADLDREWDHWRQRLNGGEDVISAPPLRPVNR